MRRHSRSTVSAAVRRRFKIVYAGDVDRDVSTLEELGAKWEADLHPDQKVYMLIIRAYVLPQLLAVTRERKEAADRTATNTVRKATNRANRKRKLAEMDQNIKGDRRINITLYTLIITALAVLVAHNLLACISVALSVLSL